MSDWRVFVYGGMASMFAEFCTFPVDTSKIRLQVQGQILDKRSSKQPYTGMLNAMKRITLEEGFTKLYSGIKPALLRQATYGALRIGFYHTFKERFTDGVSFYSNMLCGISAGALASFICNPTDVLKVRLQASGGNAPLAKSMVLLCKQEGIAGMWRGVAPNAQRAAVVASVELAVYDKAKLVIVEKTSLDPSSRTVHFGSSLVAGLAATIASNPIDVMKTRLMNQNTKSAHIYKSQLDCFTSTLRHEGAFAFYRGFIPNYLRLGPWTIVFFMSFEQLKLIEKRLFN